MLKIRNRNTKNTAWSNKEWKLEKIRNRLKVSNAGINGLTRNHPWKCLSNYLLKANLKWLNPKIRLQQLREHIYVCPKVINSDFCCESSIKRGKQRTFRKNYLEDKFR